MKRLDEIKHRIKSGALDFINRPAFRRITLIILIVSLSGAGVIFARHYYLKRSAKQEIQTEQPDVLTIDRIEIRNETRAIEVSSKKIEKDHLQIELRNAGDRPIISYRIDLRGGDRFVTDLSVGRPLDPSRKTHVGIPLMKISNDEGARKYLVNISMALFADGTGEGDGTKLQAQRDRMIGAAKAMTEMTPLVNKLESERELTSEQFGQQIAALIMKSPANFNREQTTGYLNAIRSLQTGALALNKLPNNRAKGVENFKNAFVRQRSNLKMIEQEVKR